MDQYELKQLSSLMVKVAELEKKIDFLFDKLNLQYEDETLTPQFPEVENLLRKGNKLGAIKTYQLMTGAGLSEAKDA